MVAPAVGVDILILPVLVRSQVTGLQTGISTLAICAGLLAGVSGMIMNLKGVFAAFSSYLSITSGPQLALPNPRVTASRETTVFLQGTN